MWRVHGVGLIAFGFAIAACAGLPIGPPSLPPNLAEQLEACDESFTPMLAPPEAVSASVVLERLRNEGFPPFAQRNARAAAPVYGVLADRGPKSACRGEGFVSRGDSFEIWLVVWPEVSGGNGGQAWAIVDAQTGSFTVGDGPPGG